MSELIDNLDQKRENEFLSILSKDKIPVSVFLVNGIKLQGQIDSFNGNVITLKGNVTQMIYKSAISTIVPAYNINIELNESREIGDEELQGKFLFSLEEESTPLAIFLVNGIKLKGQIGSADRNVIMLKGNITQMIYKQAISTIVPDYNVDINRD